MSVGADDLTGFFGFRENVFGAMILRVEYRVPAYTPGNFWYKWKDATADDVSILRAKGKL